MTLVTFGYGVLVAGEIASLAWLLHAAAAPLLAYLAFRVAVPFARAYGDALWKGITHAR